MQLNKLFPIITTDKLDEVRAFYTQHLGFKVSIEHPGGYLGLRSIQNADLEISFMAPCDQTQPYNGHGATLCLEVDNVDAEHQRLSQAGVPIVVPLKDNPWGDRSFISVDPAGVSVYVYSPIEPSEEYKQCFKD